VASNNSTDLRYHHQDHLTGTSLMTNASGTSLGTITYKPFGECLESQGNETPTGSLPDKDSMTPGFITMGRDVGGIQLLDIGDQYEALVERMQRRPY
jgi:hypothetical protein